MIILKIKLDENSIFHVGDWTHKGVIVNVLDNGSAHLKSPDGKSLFEKAENLLGVVILAIPDSSNSKDRDVINAHIQFNMSKAGKLKPMFYNTIIEKYFSKPEQLLNEDFVLVPDENIMFIQRTCENDGCWIFDKCQVPEKCEGEMLANLIES